MSAKVVRTTLLRVRDYNDDDDVAVYHGLGDYGYEPQDEVVILPAADYDRMVELLRAVEERGLRALPAIRAFLAETKEPQWCPRFPCRLQLDHVGPCHPSAGERGASE
jgi:hypothetical protein